MIIKILGIGLVTAVLNMFLRNYKSEFAVLVNICGGLIIFSLMIDGVQNIIDGFNFLEGMSSIKFDIVSPIMKVIGIGYITEWTADIAEDSGNKSIANKIIMGGKVAICLLALPIIQTLINAIMSLI